MRTAVFAAVATGALIAIQSAMIGAFGARMNPFVTSTWVHIGGLAFALVGVTVARLGLDFGAVRAAPWGPLAGVAGVLLVAGIAVAVGGIGLASALATITGVQLLVGFAIETWRLADRTVALDPLRIGGAVLIVVGVYLVVSRGPVHT